MGNKLLSIVELLSDRSKQGSKPLNEWLSYVFNLVEMCGYSDKVKHSEVIEILQTEDATSSTYETLKEFHSTSRQIQQPATVHYASYEKSKKSRQNPNSNVSSSQCFRCGQPFTRDHLATCKAQNVHCNECGKHGYFQIVCKSLGQFPKRQPRQQKPDSTDRKQTHYISDAPVQDAIGYYNEQGNWVAEPARHFPPSIQTVHSLSVKQKVPVIQDIHDIYPEIDPDTSLMQGMTQSQISFRETNKMFTSSKKRVSRCTGSTLHTNSMESSLFGRI